MPTREWANNILFGLEANSIPGESRETNLGFIEHVLREHESKIWEEAANYVGEYAASQSKPISDISLKFFKYFEAKAKEARGEK